MADLKPMPITVHAARRDRPGRRGDSRMCPLDDRGLLDRVLPGEDTHEVAAVGLAPSDGNTPPYCRGLVARPMDTHVSQGMVHQ